MGFFDYLKVPLSKSANDEFFKFTENIIDKYDSTSTSLSAIVYQENIQRIPVCVYFIQKSISKGVDFGSLRFYLDKKTNKYIRTIGVKKIVNTDKLVYIDRKDFRIFMRDS